MVWAATWTLGLAIPALKKAGLLNQDFFLPRLSRMGVERGFYGVHRLRKYHVHSLNHGPTSEALAVESKINAITPDADKMVLYSKETATLT